MSSPPVFNTPEDPMCEHCGSRVHVTLACKFPPEERLFAFRKPAYLDMGFHYYVSVDDGSGVLDAVTGVRKKYRSEAFTEPADAMAMWIEAVSNGAEYVTIEALRERRP